MLCLLSPPLYIEVHFEQQPPPFSSRRIFSPLHPTISDFSATRPSQSPTSYNRQVADMEFHLDKPLSMTKCPPLAEFPSIFGPFVKKPRLGSSRLLTQAEGGSDLQPAQDQVSLLFTLGEMFHSKRGLLLVQDHSSHVIAPVQLPGAYGIQTASLLCSTTGQPARMPAFASLVSSRFHINSSAQPVSLSRKQGNTNEPIPPFRATGI